MIMMTDRIKPEQENKREVTAKGKAAFGEDAVHEESTQGKENVRDKEKRKGGETCNDH